MEVPLSQSPKKPGARDISDLKARLGLKKGGSPAKPPGAGGNVPSPMGGGAIPAPTASRAVPAPPGTPEAQRAAAIKAIPDARQDPFGAMNAMAARNVAAAAPEIIVVNDGTPIENVGKKSKVGLLKLLLPAVVALVVGMTVGQMGTKAAYYNDTIDDAAVVGDQISKVDKQLLSLRNTMYTAKERGPQGTSYLLGDEQLTADLEAIAFELPDLNKVYESNLYRMDQGVVDQTLAYLTEATLLQKQLKDHVLKAKVEAKALAAGQERLQKFGLPTRYGIIVNIAKGDEAATTPVSATFVELGDPFCQDGKPNPAGCADGSPKGFLYRPSEMGPWGQKELATPEEDFIKGNRLIPLGVGEPSPTLKALFFGGEHTVSEVTYMKRITELDAKIDDLMERGKNLRKAFTTVAGQSKQFTFFM